MAEGLEALRHLNHYLADPQKSDLSAEQYDKDLATARAVGDEIGLSLADLSAPENVRRGIETLQARQEQCHREIGQQVGLLNDAVARYRTHAEGIIESLGRLGIARRYQL